MTGPSIQHGNVTRNSILQLDPHMDSQRLGFERFNYKNAIFIFHDKAHSPSEYTNHEPFPLRSGLPLI